MSHYGIDWEQGNGNQPQTSEAINARSRLLEQQVRENIDKQMDDLMKYAILAIMIMIPAAIALVIFIIGTGMIRV